MAYKVFDKKIGSGARVNEQLVEELYKPVIKKVKRWRVYVRFKDNIWHVDLAEMESLSSKNRGVKYLLCVIDVFTKYAWVKSLKDKKGKTVLNAFTKIVNESYRKPNKLWVNQGREFYNSPIQKWLDDNDILMYPTYNEGKPAVAEMFIKTLKGKIYKNMTTNDSKPCLGYLNKLIHEYNNTYHRSISNKSIDSDYSRLTEEIELNHRVPKVGDRVKITKYKNIFSKGYIENCSREVLVIGCIEN